MSERAASRQGATEPTGPAEPADGADAPGHLAELRALHAACYRRLAAKVFALTGDLAAAEDAAAEAFARAAVRPRAFRRAADPESWLRDAALTRALRRSRRAALAERLAPWRARAGHAADGAWGGDGPFAGPQAVLDGLRRLPDREREAVALHHLAGLTVHEVAALLGLSDGVVRARLDHGERRLSGVGGVGGVGRVDGLSGVDGVGGAR